jgi:CubicO group peptidase (beta-lactamase class C family)
MSLRQALDEFATRTGVPGIAVGVLHGDKTELATSGVASLGHPHPVEAVTVFQLGSVTKAITATAVLVLAQRGLLDLDTPVQTWLPHLRVAEDDQLLTMRHLLTHTAGWQGAGFVECERDEDRRDGVARCLEAVADLPRLAPAGRLYAYNNWGFTILGRLVERCVDAPFPIALRHLVTGPLGMASAGFSKTEVAPYAWSSGHVHAATGRLTEIDPWVLPASAAAAGGLAANLEDLLQFTRLHLGMIQRPDILDSATVDSMRARQGPPERPYDTGTGGLGLGWFVKDLGADDLLFHEGAGVGHRALIALIPDRKFGLAILANADQRSALTFAQWILEGYLGVRTRRPTTVTVPQLRLGQYSGRFLASRRRLDIRVAGTDLELLLSPSAHTPYGSSEVTDRWRVSFDRPDCVVVRDGPDEGLCGQFLRAGGQVAAFRLDGRVFVKHCLARRTCLPAGEFTEES